MSGAAATEVRPAPVADRLEYQPALDGVRAVSVAMVLLFHGGVSWMTGGYLGVSVFFTLSGYLITTLLLREADGTGRVRVGQFYARRARRLLPASVLVLVGIPIGSQLGFFDGVAHLERDLFGALFQVANWVQLLGGESYAEILQLQAGQQSPLDHYWSLAIEEQFYWVWPIAIGALSRRRSATARTRVMLRATAIAAIAAPVIAWVWGTDAAYWATPARASEILAGAALACLLHDGRVPRVPAMLAPACLIGIVALAVVLPASGGLAYNGGLPLVAALSTGLVLGLQHQGIARVGLSWRPLVGIGRISYGVYLYHWPIYAVLDENGTGWRGFKLLALRLVATVVVATASYLLVERPIRRATWSPARTARLGAVAVGACAVAIVAVTAPGPSTDFRPTVRAATAAAIPVVEPGEELPPLTLDGGVPSRPVRILLVGDSTALALGAGMVEWASHNLDTARVNVDATLGCGFLSGSNPDADRYRRACEYTMGRMEEHLVERRPDVVVFLTVSDLIPRSWDDGPTLSPVDDDYRRHLDDDYRAVTDRALAAGASVVWIRPAIANPWWAGEVERTEHPERRAVLDEVLAELVASDPERVRVADLQAYLEESGLDDDVPTRPDGLHLSADGAERITERWLGPLLIDAAAGAS